MVQHKLGTFDYIVLMFGAACSMLLVYYVSSNVVAAACFLPVGVGAIATALPLIRKLREYCVFDRPRQLKRLVPALLMPSVLGTLAAYYFWRHDLYLSVAYFALVALVVAAMFSMIRPAEAIQPAQQLRRHMDQDGTSKK